jgi:hypothetical protein
MKPNFEELRRKVRKLQDRGALPVWPTDEERADWAFGNTAIENDNITRDMAESAAVSKPPRRS